jgi:hypothetical protein
VCSPRMLEEREKTGPRMRRSRGGSPARRIMEALSSSTISEALQRSNRIHRRVPAFFLLTFPDTATPPPAVTERGGGGWAVCPAAADPGVADGEAAEGEARRALVALSCLGREGRRRAERFRLDEDEEDLVKNGSFRPPDRFPMALPRRRGRGGAWRGTVGVNGSDGGDGRLVVVHVQLQSVVNAAGQDQSLVKRKP